MAAPVPLSKDWVGNLSSPPPPVTNPAKGSYTTRNWKTECPTPPSLSVTVRVTVYTPAVYSWVPLTEPEPLDSVTSAASDLPSPQSNTPVCVSRTPGSVKLALAGTGVVTGTGTSGAVIAPTAGATLSIVTWGGDSVVPPSLSRI